MKCFVVLAAVLLAASAKPTEIGDGVLNIIDEHIDIASEGAGRSDNRTALWGFGSLVGFGSGTRGGQGGAVWTVWDAFALRDAVTGNAARIIYVRGRIDLTTLFTGSPGVALRVGNFKSILGGDRNAEIFGGGLRVSSAQHVIIQNMKMTNALSYAPSERPNGNGGIIGQVPGAWSTIDAIGIDTSTYVWVDHCTLSDDPWNSNSVPENQRRHDGLLDITAGANFVSVSNNMFRNHFFVGLVGNSDTNQAQDGPRLRVTYYRNWFRGTNQRHPRVRFGRVHIFNNLYEDIISYGIGLGVGASVYANNNAFINTRRAWGWASGVPNPIGNLGQANNLFQNSGFDSGIPSNIGWLPANHYSHSPMAASAVAAHVRNFAGTV